MIPFTKMHGIGNDFVMIDLIQTPLNEDWSQLAKQTCSRKFGVGADGLILLDKDGVDRFKMTMFNPDGSESEMCGNGIRCLAVLAADHGYLGDKGSLDVSTGAGLLHLEIKKNNEVKVDMGQARLHPSEIGMDKVGGERFINQPIGFEGLLGTAVSMGNPHLVIFVDDASQVPLEKWGPKIENSPLFRNRTNVHFVQVISSKECIQRTWERGAGITLACGTGACSVAVAGSLNHKLGQEVLIHLPGGDLNLEVTSDLNVFMTGPAVSVFEGKWLGEQTHLSRDLAASLA